MAEMTWGRIDALRRSHKWRVTRGMDGPTCTECGDTADSPVRYCPGRSDA